MPHSVRPRTVVRAALTLVLGLAGIAILCLLGSWQLERLAWKNDLIAQIEARRHAEPVSAQTLAAHNDPPEELDYRPVTAVGVFEHGGERAFLSTREGQAGWNIHTPLRLDDGSVIFVNRGFVPYDRKSPDTRPESQITGRVSLTGLARPYASEKPASFVPDNDPAANTFFWRHLPDLVAGSGLSPGTRVLPFVIDAGPGTVPGSYPIGGTTIVDMPNNHLQYAITWFGLALVLAAMLVFSLVRRPRSDPPTNA